MSDYIDEYFDIAFGLPQIIITVFSIVFTVIIITSIVRIIKNRNRNNHNTTNKSDPTPIPQQKKINNIDPFGMDSSASAPRECPFGLDETAATNDHLEDVAPSLGSDSEINAAAMMFAMKNSGLNNEITDNTANVQKKDISPKFCPFCGAPKEEGKFCPFCGNKFE